LHVCRLDPLSVAPPAGRVTVAVLDLNDPLRVELRERLIDEGLFPPA
jgi:hypothetical protein